MFVDTLYFQIFCKETNKTQNKIQKNYLTIEKTFSEKGDPEVHIVCSYVSSYDEEGTGETPAWTFKDFSMASNILLGMICALDGCLWPSCSNVVLKEIEVWSHPTLIPYKLSQSLAKHPPLESPGFEPAEPRMCPLELQRVDVKIP